MVKKRKIYIKYIAVLAILFQFFSHALINASDSDTHELTREVYINEVMASNGNTVMDSFGGYEDWIELYNPSAFSVDLSGYYLSDDPQNPLKWKFPSNSIIVGRGYMVVWASGRDKTGERGDIHTSFSVSREGEYILLTSSDKSTLVDIFEPVYIPRDFSYGRKPDGSDNWVYFDINNASPGRSNNNSEKSSGIINPELNPSFSRRGGFYNSDFILMLESKRDAEIYYTTDGSVPTRDSTRYTEPVVVEKKFIPPGFPVQEITEGVTPSRPISFIKTNPEDAADLMQWHPPEEEIYKATTVRAVSYGKNGDISQVVTRTYFVDPAAEKRYSFPVISITMDKHDLFDFDTGIYVPGRVYEEEGYGDSFWGTPNANYHQRGREWERPAHVEFFEEDGSLAFSQNIGVRIHGSGTRVLPQKSLRLYARKDYDIKNYFEHEIFPGLKKTGSDNSDLQSFKRLILRTGGQEFYRTIFKDVMLQSLIEHEKIDTQASRPSVVFINGEYWGIHNVRERFDLHFLASNYGENPEDYAMVISTGRLDKGEPGDERHYRDMVAFARDNDMSKSENYEYIKTLLDVDNYIQYLAFQINIGNHDWPSNNVNVWRYKTEYNPEAPYGLDGRWRFMIFDVDYGYGFRDVTFNTLSNIVLTEDEGSEKPDWSTRLFRGLIENEEFKVKLLNCFADQLNTILKPERVVERIDYFEDLFRPEINEHIDRWNKYPRESSASWERQVERLRTYARERPENMYEHIAESLGVKETFELTIDVSDDSMGYVKLNYIEINENTKGVFGDVFPWQGTYFREIPVEITAVANPGYLFTGWKETGNEDSFIRMSFSEDTILTAVFDEDPYYIPETDEDSTDESSSSRESSGQESDDERLPVEVPVLIFSFGIIIAAVIIIKGF